MESLLGMYCTSIPSDAGMKDDCVPNNWKWEWLNLPEDVFIDSVSESELVFWIMEFLAFFPHIDSSSGVLAYFNWWWHTHAHNRRSESQAALLAAVLLCFTSLQVPFFLSWKELSLCQGQNGVELALLLLLFLRQTDMTVMSLAKSPALLKWIPRYRPYDVTGSETLNLAGR